VWKRLGARRKRRKKKNAIDGFAVEQKRKAPNF
jgi:hypothetical protein